MDEQIVNVWEEYNTRKNGFFFLDMNEDTYFNIFQYYDFDGRRISDHWKGIIGIYRGKLDTWLSDSKLRSFTIK
ncbi:MAG: hypothetical protein EGP77_02840 [Lachnospiraceae bacterium]|jgi:hypothetical protein|nr:hypothetical protein [Lachnospiraceae bacterium]OKZ99182.1 MAG: hypothetical protein BHV90_17490 [Clostridiales bacterium 42_27]